MAAEALEETAEVQDHPHLPTSAEVLAVTEAVLDHPHLPTSAEILAETAVPDHPHPPTMAEILAVEADLPITVTVVALTNLAMAVTAEVPAVAVDSTHSESSRESLMLRRLSPEVF